MPGASTGAYIGTDNNNIVDELIADMLRLEAANEAGETLLRFRYSAFARLFRALDDLVFSTPYSGH